MASPRTGSTHLDQLLGSCTEFNAKAELFHPKWFGRIDQAEFEAVESVSAGDVADVESFLAWRKDHPLETLEALHRAGSTKIVVFKLFPGHVRRPIFERQLLQRNDIGFAILRRRPIECFISNLKANQVGIYKNVDTTQLRPIIMAGEFLDWAARMRAWFDWVNASLETRRQPFARIGYDEHLCRTPTRDALLSVRELLRPIGIPEFAIPSEITEETRQDLEPDYRERVENWKDFEAELLSRQPSNELLQWAQEQF